jgi:hypothetical protein
MSSMCSFESYKFYFMNMYKLFVRTFAYAACNLITGYKQQLMVLSYERAGATIVIWLFRKLNRAF